MLFAGRSHTNDRFTRQPEMYKAFWKHWVKLDAKDKNKRARALSPRKLPSQMLRSMTLKASTSYLTKLEKKSEHSLFNFQFGAAWSDVFLKRRKTECESNLTRFCNLRHGVFNDHASLNSNTKRSEIPSEACQFRKSVRETRKKMMCV